MDRFKQIIAIVFLAAFALQTFSSYFMVVDYFSNTTAFARNCENKSRPMLHCNGKCQLMKKIKEAEKKHAEAPESRSENKREIAQYTKDFYTTPEFIYTEIAQSFSVLRAENPVDMPGSLLRPPC